MATIRIGTKDAYATYTLGEDDSLDFLLKSDSPIFIEYFFNDACARMPIYCDRQPGKATEEE